MNKPNNEATSLASEVVSQERKNSRQASKVVAQDNSIRLQVFISHSGVCSRRAAATAIEEGRVKVNREVIRVAGHRIDPKIDIVTIDGKRCILQQEYVYFVMNKPRKVESTNYSETSRNFENKYSNSNKTNKIKSASKFQKKSTYSEPRRTVKDIISQIYEGHIFSVGRLDYYTSGLLILTTDGQLCNRLSHPRYGIEKTYLLETTQDIDITILEKWLASIKIKGITYTLTRYKYLAPNKVELVLIEGKNREIRNVCEYFHILIDRLHRQRYGSLTIKNLPVGKVRQLTQLEIKTLYKSVNLHYER